MERKKVNRTALAVLGVALMLLNYWLSITIKPFSAFAVMALVTNVVIGLGFASVYRTITRKDGK